MASPVTYSPDSNLIFRIYDQLAFALKPELPGHKQEDKYLFEKIGDFGLWPVEHFPEALKKLKQLAYDPRIVTVFVTATALWGVSFGYYPTTTVNLTRTAITEGLKIMAKIPLDKIRFTSYIMSIGTVLAAFCRAEGRFTNPPLYDKFYSNNLK